MTSNRRKHLYRRVRAFLSKPLVINQVKPVIMDAQEYCRNPIFLIGVHRSGTSLVRRLFNAHPNIACPPETFYLKHYCQLFKDPMTSAGMRGFGYSAEETRKIIARQASSFHEAYRIAEGKKRWADKTPQYTACLSDLGDLFRDGAKFVLIFRNPMDVAYSIFDRGWIMEGYGEDPLDNAANYVSDRITRMYEFYRSNPERCVTLRYDRLNEDPVTELTRVLRFLGEDFHSQMLEFNRQSQNFGTEDPIVRGTSEFRGSFNNWRALSNDQQDQLEGKMLKAIEVYSSV